MTVSKSSSAGNDLVGETDVDRLFRINLAARQTHLERTLISDEARKPLRAAGARDDPEQDLRLPDTGIVCEIPKVGSHGEFESTAEGEPSDCRNRRLLEGLELGHNGGEGCGEVGVAIAVKGLLEAGDVGPRREVRAPGDDHGPYVVGCRL